MRVLFLYLSWQMCRDGEAWYYDEGAGSTAACLERAGHDVRFRIVGPREERAEVARWIEEAKGEKTLLVLSTSLLFSSFGHDRPDALSLVAGLGREQGLRTAMVGIYATLNREELIAKEGVDVVGCGEMDEALVELCDALEAGDSINSLANFWVQEGETVHRNPLRPLVSDLSALPVPRRDLVPLERMANEADGILTVVATRGCPLRCNFCTNLHLARLYRDDPGYVRVKSVDRLLEEIRVARVRLPDLLGVFFHDDIFGSSPSWLREFLERYPEEVGLPFGCNLLAAQVTPEFARDLHRAGCRQVQIGVESGSDFLRNHVINKGVTEEEIREAVDALRAAGVSVKLFTMLGIPRETSRLRLDSLRRLASFHADMVQVQIWQAHHGSPLLEFGPPSSASDRDLQSTYRHFHRFLALFEAIEEMASRKPRRAALLRWGVGRGVRHPFLVRFFRRRSGALRRRLQPLLLSVEERERRLASVFRWPEGCGEPPAGPGWVGAGRVDRRSRYAGVLSGTRPECPR